MSIWPSDINLHPSLTKWSTLSSLPVASFPVACQILPPKSLETHGHTRFVSKKCLIYLWIWPSDINLHPQLNQMEHAFVASCCVISGRLSYFATEITRGPWAHKVFVEKTLNLHVDVAERHYFTFPSLTKWCTLSSLPAASFPVDF